MEYPQNCSKRPDYRLKLVEKILDRVETIKSIFKMIQENGHFTDLHLSDPVLYAAIESYYSDIDRTKCFHEIDLSDEHKKAAFSVKWFVRFRPIQLVKDIPDKSLSFEHLLANETFALILALSLLDLGDNAIDITDKYMGNLIYCMRFRETNAMVLSSMFYLLQKSLKKEPI